MAAKGAAGQSREGRASCLWAVSCSQAHMDILAKHRELWNEEYWMNPWDEGSLAVIILFIAMILFLVLFAVTFGTFPLLKSVECNKQ